MFGVAGALILGVNIWQGTNREERTLPGEILASMGPSLTAPAAYYVTRLHWKSTALVRWLLSILYFVSSVIYVKLRVSTRHERKPGATARLREACVLYHAALLAFVCILFGLHLVAVAGIAAFLPVVARRCILSLSPERSSTSSASVGPKWPIPR